MSEQNKLLEIKNLSKEFSSKKKNVMVKAVSDVNFTVMKGETFGLVGESGCGKTTLGRCIARGIEATRGQALFTQENGVETDFLQLKGDAYKTLRKDIQMIFQDPYSSLDPRMTVYEIIAEPLKANFKLSNTEMYERIKKISEACGLPSTFLKRYPHAFSGGQRQRIGIARSLITNPKLIICDEAVSALDISIQAQIINLLKDLQQQFNITYIFISHALSVVEYISDRVAVMYLGKVVELVETNELFMNPMHPYTEALLSAVPKPDPTKKMKRIILEGEVPNPSKPPSGCHFHPRCRYCKEQCKTEAPALRETEPGHFTACHFANELKLTPIRARENGEKKQ